MSNLKSPTDSTRNGPRELPPQPSCRLRLPSANRLSCVDHHLDVDDEPKHAFRCLFEGLLARQRTLSVVTAETRTQWALREHQRRPPRATSQEWTPRFLEAYSFKCPRFSFLLRADRCWAQMGFRRVFPWRLPVILQPVTMDSTVAGQVKDFCQFYDVCCLCLLYNILSPLSGVILDITGAN